MHRVFLIPGFFGFSTLGRMRYFAHVHSVLAEALARQGIDAVLHDVPTLPTATFERRAYRLAEVVLDASEPGDPLHLVGHSSGGVDARMAVSSPAGVRLPAGWGERLPDIRTVIGVATPHHGTPIAGFFATRAGERWLRLLSLLTLHVLRLGSFAPGPTQALLGVIEARGRPDEVPGGLLDDIWHDVLGDFQPMQQQELRAFFEEVWKDRALLGQLTPQAMRRLSASLVDRAGVRYGSVVLRARPPGGGLTHRFSRLQPSTRMFQLLHSMAAWSSPPALPRVPEEWTKALYGHLGGALGSAASDAIIPTVSQVHGELVHAAIGDHLDVLGYFRGPDHEPPHVDWLRSHSDFTRADFVATWGAVARFIAGSAPPEP